MEKYSIVIPVLNGERSIELLLKSILVQTLKAWEIIVVDNGSSDRTAQIVKKYSSVKYIYESKKGRSIARNTGARVASGDVLCFVDCDVILDKDWLKNCDAYKKEFQVDFFTTSISLSYSNNKLDEMRRLWGFWKTHGTFLSLMKYDDFFPVINTAACVIERKIFFEEFGFDETRFRNEDLEFSIRLACNGYVLGGCSSAKSEVSFLSGENNWKRYFKYVVRNIEIQKDLATHNQYRFFSTIEFKYYLYLLKEMHILILAMTCFNKAVGGIFSFFPYMKNKNKVNFFLSKKIVFQNSFSFNESIYMPNKPFILLNIDGNFYIKDDQEKFKFLANEIGTLLLRLKNGKRISNSEKELLLKSGLY